MPEADARARALRLLARREHGRTELRRKLAARGIDAAAAEAALDELEREGLLSERRYLESFLHQRAERGYGPLRIRAELRERGVDDALAERALAEAGTDWVEAARTVRRKRFGDDAPANFRERARQARFLQYRGFDGEQVRRALGADEAD